MFVSTRPGPKSKKRKPDVSRYDDDDDSRLHTDDSDWESSSSSNDDEAIASASKKRRKRNFGATKSSGKVVDDGNKVRNLVSVSNQKTIYEPLKFSFCLCLSYLKADQERLGVCI